MTSTNSSSGRASEKQSHEHLVLHFNDTIQFPSHSKDAKILVPGAESSLNNFSECSCFPAQIFLSFGKHLFSWYHKMHSCTILKSLADENEPSPSMNSSTLVSEIQVFVYPRVSSSCNSLEMSCTYSRSIEVTNSQCERRRIRFDVAQAPSKADSFLVISCLSRQFLGPLLLESGTPVLNQIYWCKSSKPEI